MANWACLLPLALIIGLVVVMLPVLFSALIPPTAGMPTNEPLPESIINLAQPKSSTTSSQPGSSITNPIIVPTIFHVSIVGNGPTGHNYIYRASQIDKLKNYNSRKFLVLEKQAYSPGRCGKIDDPAIPHFDTSSMYVLLTPYISSLNLDSKLFVL